MCTGLVDLREHVTGWASPIQISEIQSILKTATFGSADVMPQVEYSTPNLE